MRLSEHFTLAEFERSETAARRGIDNRVPERLLPDLQRLVDEVLEPLRVQLGAAIHITSGYRCPAVNSAVGSSDRSAHLRARAADIVATGYTPYELAHLIASSGLPFDQVILEFGEWVHVGIAAGGVQPRRQALTAVSQNGATRYLRGLLA